MIVKFGATLAAPSFSSTIEKFLTSYLLSEQTNSLTPFGGRGIEIKKFDEWLADASAPARLLLLSPAGRGKSALIVNWIKQLQYRECCHVNDTKWQIAFVPISLRFETNKPEIFYCALASRLAQIVDHRVDAPRVDSAAYYRDECAKLLDIVAFRKIPVIVIIDGADESLRESFSTEWFPRGSGPTLRLLVTARIQVNRLNSKQWARRFGWTDGLRWTSILLNPLDEPAVSDIVKQSFHPKCEFASQSGFIARLTALSEGEPLLLKLYIEDLQVQIQKGATTVGIDYLYNFRPGFADYFERWIELQKSTWDEEFSSVDEDTIQSVLAVLACAFGPISAEALLRLSSPSNSLSLKRVEDILRPIRRFVMGSAGRPDEEIVYTLAHPKFGEYLRSEYLNKNLITMKRHAFMDWGLEIVRELSSGLTQPSDVPSYILQFLGNHIDENDCFAEHMSLVTKGWLDAHHSSEGGYAGFTSDVTRAKYRIISNPAKYDLPLALQARCQIILCSLQSIGKGVMPILLATAVRHGIVSPRHACRSMNYYGDYQKVELIKLLVDDLPTYLVSEIRNMVHDIEPPYNRALFASSLLRVSSDETANDLLETYIAPIFKSENPALIFKTQVEILSRLPDNKFTIFKNSIIRAIKNTKISDLDLDDLVDAYAVIMQFMPSNFIWLILKKIRISDDDMDSALAIAALAPYLKGKQLSYAFDLIDGINSYEERMHALSSLSEYLPIELRDQTVNLVMAGARDELASKIALARVAGVFAREDRIQALRSAYNAIFTSGEDRIETSEIIDLIPKFEGQERDDLIKLSLKKLGEDTWFGSEAGALKKIMPYIPPTCIERAILIADKVEENDDRAFAFEAIAEHLPPHYIQQALIAASKLKDEAYIGSALYRIASYFSGSESKYLKKEALSIIRSDKSLINKACALVLCETELSRDLSEECLDYITQYSYDQYAHFALIDLLPSLNFDQLNKAVDIACNFEHGGFKLAAMEAMATRLNRENMLKSWNCILEVKEKWDRAEGLATLAKFLPRDLVQQSRYLIEQIDVPHFRALLAAGLSDLRDIDSQHEVVDLINKIDDINYRADVCYEIAKMTSGEFGEEMAKSAFHLHCYVSLGRPIFDIGDLLPASWIDKALELVSDIERADVKAYALGAIVGRLSSPTRLIIYGEALDAARESLNGIFLARYLLDLSMKCSDFGVSPPIDEVMKSIEVLEDPEMRIEWFTEIGSKLPSSEDRRVVDNIFADLSQVPRTMALRALPIVYPAVFRLEGPRGLRSLTQSIRDVGLWFP
ncbi:hypothetical protein ABZT49_05965 [Methylobacterium sp. EM32]|uniref:hypothetical protein n=1 Tax=Methylobacterium sp. EM32 TaxID=3163481 RepID=UPI0033BD311F